MRFARNEVPILRVPVVSFIKVLIAVVRRLRHVECTRVDNFLLNLKQHSCKPQPRCINNIAILHFFIILEHGLSAAVVTRVSLNPKAASLISYTALFILLSKLFIIDYRGSTAASLAKPKCSLFVIYLSKCRKNSIGTELFYRYA